MAETPCCPYCGESDWAIEINDSVRENHLVSWHYEQGRQKEAIKLANDNHTIVVIYCGSCKRAIGATYIGRTPR